ncbi:MAG: hypothetical protein OXH53_13935 [bacterium]|nr:hypothetical protein [bacterium]
MSSIAAFFVFLLVMLALATLAIILDWMGKPIRRSFRPRTTGTPAWLMTEAALPSEDPISSPAADYAAAQTTDFDAGAGPVEPLERQAQPAALNPGPPQEHIQGVSQGISQEPPQEEPISTGPWQAGESIFKLTPRGTPPSITAVRRRYWKNLSERRSSVVFGEENRTLMAVGQAPQRFNPRTSTIEELSLPEPMLRYCWATKRRPTPTWEDKGLDPFAGP